MRAAVLVATLSLVFAAGCKGDREKCEKAARNFATLVFWKKADAEIAALPVAQREAERKARLAAFTAELESEIDFITEQCVNANNDTQVDCMLAAKTGDAAADCADLIKPD